MQANGIGVGSRVRKIGGSFQHAGTVVSVFETISGDTRIVLEFEAPVAGMLHIYRPDQVEAVREDYAAPEAPACPECARHIQSASYAWKNTRVIEAARVVLEEKVKRMQAAIADLNLG